MGKTGTKAKSRTRLYIILTVVILLAMLGFGYFLGYQYYSEHFPRNTTINGMDVGNMTADSVKLQLERRTQSYTLTIQERNDKTETISAEDVGLAYQDDGSVDALLASYNPALWIVDFFSADALTVDETSLSLDTDLANEVLSKLDCFNDALVQKPQDACLSFSADGCTITPEVEGNELDETAAREKILSALRTGVTELDLDAEGLYTEPEVTSDDPVLTTQKEQVDPWLKTVLTYDFEDDRIYTVDATVIADWLVLGEDGTYDLDSDKVYQWIRSGMAYDTDTFGLTHIFETTGGATVTLKGGDYGWCIDRDETTTQIIEAVKSGTVAELEPVYLYTAMNRGLDDIGGTYVEVSIQEQHAWLYKDYEILVEGDVITGDVSKGYDTPSGGVWAIDAKKSPAVLGTIDVEGYSSKVDYWMPFNGEVGLHDAGYWRPVFGGDIYLTNGSHGCVNLNHDMAEIVYNTVVIGSPVIVY